MVTFVAALLFTAAFAVSFWAMFITIQPRLGYMRMLLRGHAVPDLAPAVTPRARNVTRPAAVSTLARPLRAAA
jgi:hypothetical protein